jgi:hypothetical protein
MLCEGCSGCTCCKCSVLSDVPSGCSFVFTGIPVYVLKAYYQVRRLAGHSKRPLC